VEIAEEADGVYKEDALVRADGVSATGAYQCGEDE
jgi:hypothetical protein